MLGLLRSDLVSERPSDQAFPELSTCWLVVKLVFIVVYWSRDLHNRTRPPRNRQTENCSMLCFCRRWSLFVCI